MAVQKISVNTAKQMVIMLHGAHVLITTLDIQNIISPQAHHIGLGKDPLKTMTVDAMHVVIVVIDLKAVHVIVMIAKSAIASHLFMTAGAKITMPNTKTIQDQGQDHNQGPIQMILNAQGTIMVTISIKMIAGEGYGHYCHLPSLI